MSPKFEVRCFSIFGAISI